MKPIWEINHNMLVPYYLMSSYLYYKLDDCVISDGEFDDICKTLNEKWDMVEHFHKHLVIRDNLLSGTGFCLTDNVDFPNRVKNAAKSWLENKTAHMIEEIKKQMTLEDL